jgi:molybdopterin-containing oxidoreductase family membrane subunit
MSSEGTLKIYLRFWKQMIVAALTGGARYYLWLFFLTILTIVGVVFWWSQFQQGLVTTNLTNQVSWGVYIANFTYLVGVLAVAVLLVIPSFLWGDKSFKEVVLLGQLLAFSVIIMCLLFIAVDLGQPGRFLHIMPFIGKMNFPNSILAWDVIVLNGYLIINFFIPAYILFKMYMNQEPEKKFYSPFILISIAWALSIHAVSAFLYSGLGGRPHWNSAVLAPRFIISAFANGPAILIIIFSLVERLTAFKPKPAVYKGLIDLMAFTLTMNIFLFGCEAFKEFYTDSVHVASMQYLMFGLHGYGMLRGYIWAAIIMEVVAAIFLLIPRTRYDWRFLPIVCIFVIVGVWIEKGMGLIVPGFIPTPLGNIVEYEPSLVEFFVSLGIWAIGAFVYTILAKVCIAIQTGQLRYDKASTP